MVSLEKIKFSPKNDVGKNIKTIVLFVEVNFEVQDMKNKYQLYLLGKRCSFFLGFTTIFLDLYDYYTDNCCKA